MPDDSLVDAFPLERETTESILARLLSDINAGVDPTDPAYADVVPGSVWDDLNRGVTLEFDRLYDRALTEVPAAALPLTATGAWLDGWATVAGLQRKTATPAQGTVRFTGDAGSVIPNQASVAAPAPLPGADPIIFQTTEAATVPSGVGYVDVPVVAVLAGAAGNVAANSVTLIESEISGVMVTNPARMGGGSDIETDEQLQERVDRALNQPPGPGNIDYYVNLVLNTPGIGFVTVQPNTPTVGHVTVIISDVDNGPSPASQVAALQQQLDPGGAPGAGYGDAAVGATVIVETVTVQDITVAATIAYELGYSRDGAGGTIALQAPIATAVENYADRRPAASSVLFNKVLAAILDVPGVANVSGLTLNGSAADVVLGAQQVASIVVVNLS